MKKFIIAIVIIGIIGGFIYLSVKNADGKDVNTFDVKVKELEMNKISETISANGAVYDVENKSILIDTAVQIKKVNVANYQKVTKGQKLIEVDTESLKSDYRLGDVDKKIKEIENLCTSPFDGVVSELAATEGTMTSSMQPLMKIVNIDKLQVKTDIKEMYIKKIKEGQMVKITGDAIEENENITGKILSIAPIAKRVKTMSGEEAFVETVITLDKTSKLLKPGISVNCEITTQSKDNVVLATYEMIKENKTGDKIVYVVGNDNIIHEKKIKLGLISDLSIEVLEGATKGEKVVLNPLPVIKDGVKAKIVK